MHNQSFVFAQLASHLNRSKFNRIVAKYQGDNYIKHFTCWNQLKVLMFDQLSRRESLRDLIVAVEAHSGKAKFRKKKGGIKIHTLYDVEAQVPAFFHITTASVHDSQAMKEIPVESGSYYIFDRAYNFFSQLYRFNCAGAFFVVRAKKNLQYKAIKGKRRMPKNVLSDSVVELITYKSSKDYPEHLRRVEYYDEEQDRHFVFLTNAMDITALEVALLYKNRWSVELFFKWVKQHLKIKKFWGDSENAVRIQIYTAIISYCLVAIVHHKMKLKMSVYNTLQVLGISLTDTTPLEDLFNKSNLNIDKELDGFDEPTLFDV